MKKQMIQEEVEFPLGLINWELHSSTDSVTANFKYLASGIEAILYQSQQNQTLFLVNHYF